MGGGVLRAVGFCSPIIVYLWTYINEKSHVCVCTDFFSIGLYLFLILLHLGSSALRKNHLYGTKSVIEKIGSLLNYLTESFHL